LLGGNHCGHLHVATEVPYLVYNFHSFNSGELEIEFLLSPTLYFTNGEGLKFAISVDNKEPQLVNMHSDTNDNWDTTVSNNVTSVNAKINLDEPGNHTLKIYAFDHGIVLQKVIIKKGEIKPFYLRPLESFKVTK